MNIDPVVYPKGRPLGDVFVRPFGKDKKPLSDPFSIFQDAETVKQHTLSNPEFKSMFEATGVIPVGDNLVVNLGRQTLANLLGGRDYATAPQDWIISYVSFGTYDEVPRFTDQSLSPQPLDGSYVGGENSIQLGVDELDEPVYHKLISSVDWPQPYIVRFECVLEEAEANGELVREIGLWTKNKTLFARKAIVPINKDSSYGLSLLWRIRL